MKAVRISEEADLYHDAGLLPQALKLYEESSNTFTDAYCIHARIARTLMQQGKTEEALIHYRRAYELMPASFGRIESMCLGCEGLFTSLVQRNLALTVFEKLVKELPKKPQVRYMLGLLRSQSGDPAGALVSFEEAVRLDPDYFNAWSEILDLADHGVVSPAKLKEAALAAIRLDPLAEHGSYKAMKIVTDYKLLWRAFAKAHDSLPPAPKGPLYPLHKRTKEPEFEFSSFQSGPGDAPLRRSPGAAIGNLESVRGIFSLKRFSD